MKASSMSMMTIIGEKRERFLEKYNCWMLKRLVMNGIRSRARIGKYDYSHDIEISVPVDTMKSLIEHFEEKGYTVKSRIALDFFGHKRILEIEWGNSKDE